MLGVEQNRLKEHGAAPFPVAKGARRKLRYALEMHLERLLADGVASASLVRHRQITAAVDIRVGQSRGSSKSLRDFLTEAERTRNDDEQELEQIYQIIEPPHH